VFFRFGSALSLCIAISLVGIALEKKNLGLRREMSRQHFQMDVLIEKYATLRFRSQELGAPARLLEPPEESKQQPTRPPIVSRKTTIPLLNLPQHNSSQLGE